MDVVNCKTCNALVYEADIPTKKTGNCWRCEVARLKQEVKALSAQEPTSREKRRFPLSGGHLTISWEGAQRAYEGYRRMIGNDQTLERLAQRGGFGIEEFAWYWYQRRDMATDQGIATALADADVRPNR